MLYLLNKEWISLKNIVDNVTFFTFLLFYLHVKKLPMYMLVDSEQTYAFHVITRDKFLILNWIKWEFEKWNQNTYWHSAKLL